MSSNSKSPEGLGTLLVPASIEQPRNAGLSRREFSLVAALGGFAAVTGCVPQAVAPVPSPPGNTTMQGPFTFRAAYNWGDVFSLDAPGNHARGGRLVGSWSWAFANGQRGNTHFSSASFFRLNPYRLTGFIAFEMWELDGSPRGEQQLFISYEGLSTTPEGVTTIEAVIVGGTGRYAGATGTVRWISRNGFIDEGSGTLNTVG